MDAVYCTREEVKSALDLKQSARNNIQVDRSIQAAARSIEGLLHRKFYPWTGTREISASWLDDNELVSVSAITDSGVAVLASNYSLSPSSGPPYTKLTIDVGVGDDLEVTGVFGYRDDAEVAGTLVDAITNSQTTIKVTNSAVIGVGSLIRVENERMIVNGRHLVTTAQNLQVALTGAKSDNIVAVTNGSTFFVDEMITLDAERMLIVDIAGNNLIVERAVDGSVLASHAGSLVYASRTLSVQRGALGTAAVSHAGGLSLTKHLVPTLINQLAIAESITAVQQESAGYARTAGSGDNERLVGGSGIKDLRMQAVDRYGRKSRFRTV